MFLIINNIWLHKPVIICRVINCPSDYVSVINCRVIKCRVIKCPYTIFLYVVVCGIVRKWPKNKYRKSQLETPLTAPTR